MQRVAFSLIDDGFGMVYRWELNCECLSDALNELFHSSFILLWLVSKKQGIEEDILELLNLDKITQRMSNYHFSSINSERLDVRNQVPPLASRPINPFPCICVVVMDPKSTRYFTEEEIISLPAQPKTFWLWNSIFSHATPESIFFQLKQRSPTDRHPISIKIESKNN